MLRTKLNNSLLFSILILNLSIQFLLIASNKFLFFQIGIVLLLLVLIWAIHSKINLQLVLIVLTILTFVYLKKTFSRNIYSIMVQDIPLMLIFILAIFEWLRNLEIYKISISYVFVPLVIYYLFSLWLSFYGLILSHPVEIVFLEFYQATYFILALPIYFLIGNRKSYLILLYVLIAVFSIISFQYIVMNILLPIRFTTYHNHIFPLLISFSLSGIIFLRNQYYKFFSIFIFLIIWFGSIATETRTLWVANLISMSVVFFMYLKYKGLRLKYIIVISIIILSLLSPLLLTSTKSASTVNNVSVEQKAESITNPLEEVSFLMRVEAIYLSYKQIVKKPFLGYGFGYLLQMKYLLQTKYIFPDNNYIYYFLKGGMFYLLIVLWMFYRILKVSYNLFVKSRSNIIKFTMSGIFAGIVGIMFFALMNANLIKLRLNLIYAIIFAYVNFEYKNYFTTNTSIQNNKFNHLDCKKL